MFLGFGVQSEPKPINASGEYVAWANSRTQPIMFVIASWRTAFYHFIIACPMQMQCSHQQQQQQQLSGESLPRPFVLDESPIYNFCNCRAQ